ncbi:MAG: transcriptional repressor [Eubacteriaceae bacterium]
MVENRCAESICAWDVESIHHELRKNGYKLTKQRKLIIEVILKNKCTYCKEIYAETIKKDSSVGISTVYRMFRILEDLGIEGVKKKNIYLGFKDQESECILLLDENEEVRLPSEVWISKMKESFGTIREIKNKKIRGLVFTNIGN